MKNTNYTFILVCLSHILAYYFSKGFVILERNYNNLWRVENNTKQRIHAMDMNDSEYVMICNTSTLSISNTLKKLWIPSDFHSSYIQTIYNYKEEIMNDIFIKYFETLLGIINHPALAE